MIEEILSKYSYFYLCFRNYSEIVGVNLTAQDLLHQDARIQDFYFNISVMKSITSLFSVQIMSYLGESDKLYSNVTDSFISEILKYLSWILASWCKSSWTVRFTPVFMLMRREEILLNHFFQI